MYSVFQRTDILTNLHVIEDANRAIVTLYDGKFYTATLVGADPVNDVAVDGEKTMTAEEFLTAVERHKPGETVELTILRGGRTMQIKVRLGGGASGQERRSV